ncbi:MAG: aminotransferase class IV [Bacteroidales bacterium]|nr:aminotransferase class IV [Bacteroidales bacterium]
MRNCLLNYFIVNNELKSTCDFDPALVKQGNGVYELLRVIGGKPLFLEDHTERFFRSLQLAGLPSGINKRQLNRSLKTLIDSNKLKNGNIRFQYTVHPRSASLFLARVVPAFYPTESDFQKGVKVVALQAERENPNAKRDKLPARLAADRLIAGRNVFEVLLVDSKGFVTEGSRTNVFFVEGEKIITPPLSFVLPGVTRSKIVLIAKKNGIAVAGQPVSFDEISRFESVFLSGTSINVLPVEQIDELKFSTVSRLVKDLRKHYSELAAEYIRTFSWDH